MQATDYANAMNRLFSNLGLIVNCQRFFTTIIINPKNQILAFLSSY